MRLVAGLLLVCSARRSVGRHCCDADRRRVAGTSRHADEANAALTVMTTLLRGNLNRKVTEAA